MPYPFASTATFHWESVLSIWLLVSLSACTQATAIPQPTFPPAITSSLPLIEIIPTPSATDKTTITGYLLHDVINPQPVAGVALYLADILPETQGTPWLAGYERQSSPRTQTDSAGRFVFVDIPSGQYALIFDLFYETVMLGNPENGSDLILEPQPGQILDLGRLVYASLPGFDSTP